MLVHKIVRWYDVSLIEDKTIMYATCRTIALILMLLLSGMGSAVALENGEQAPPAYVFLGRMTSQPGETKDAFALRVATRLSAFTQNTGFEGCGELMGSNSGKVWRVYLVTIQAHVGCMRVKFEDASFTAINESIHSHPQTTSIRANIQDGRFYAFAACGSPVQVEPKSFSDGDFRSGSGYLVAKANSPFAKVRLLHQEGRGTERVVGRVDGGEVSLDQLESGEVLPVSRVSTGAVALAVTAIQTACASR